ncbi:hypothetical protein DZA28_04310 [Pseudomonas alloputida]|uniref:Uncharacterized protein n=2 Tax=Pseudomonas TaxID=286 RepID=A0ABD6N143_9PSED|nr:hypothetical protein [Pseudomonas hunanensis]PTV57569.1 hypothetical protein DBL03_19745 [Pseudomonas putida]TRZ59206.1 hypothetical protein DZA28_04310 [Pseudomonas alloputida]
MTTGLRCCGLPVGAYPRGGRKTIDFALPHGLMINHLDFKAFPGIAAVEAAGCCLSTDTGEKLQGGPLRYQPRQRVTCLTD